MVLAILAGMIFPIIYLAMAATGLSFSIRHRRHYPRASRSAVVGFLCLLLIGLSSLLGLLGGLWYVQASGMDASQLETLGLTWRFVQNVLTVFALIMIGRAVFLDRVSHQQ